MAQAYQQFSPLNALAFVQQQGDIGRERGQRNQLNQLAGHAYSATTPEEQRGLLTSMAVIDPAAAQQQQKSFAYDEERRNTTMVNMAKLLTSAPEQARPGLYQQMAPTLAKFGLSDLPRQYDAQTAPIINQAAQSLVQAYSGGAGGNVQSTYVNDQGQRVAIMRDGSTQVLGGNDAGANQQTLTIDVNGTPTQVTFDRRTGRYTNASLGAPAAQVQQINGQPTYIDPSLPPQVQAALRAGAGDNLQDGGQLQVPQAGGVPLQGRRAEDQAGAVERAKIQAQLDAAQQVAEAEARAAALKKEAEAAASARAEAVQNLPRVMQESTNAINLIDKALSHPGLATSVGASGRADPRNYIPGTDATDFRVLLDQIKGGTFLQAFQSLKGGGAITEVEGTKAEQAIARLNRDQSEQAFRQSLQDLREVAQAAITRAQTKAEAGGGMATPQQQAAPRQIQSAEEYNALPSGVLFIAPDGTQRRKR